MVKKCMALLLAAASAFALFCLPARAAGRGDADEDGAVTSADARLALRFSVLLEAPTASQRTACDVDGDGDVTASDARLILRIAVGLNRDYFTSTLYSVAHRYDGLTADQLPQVDHLIENGYRAIGKWCCYYTVHDVFRPALAAAGYSKERIDQLAPNSFTGEKLNRALRTATSINIPAVLLENSDSVYIPSILADYYLTHPQYAKTYTFGTYFDDVVDQRLRYPSSNRSEYVPEIGDILFASNKTSTYVDGFPTIDHTAQIIAVYPDGSFLCTDGCIKFDDSDKPRVCEREYVWDASRGMYIYRYNSVVQVLMIAKPDL